MQEAHVCDTCFVYFPSQEQLKIHSVIHSYEKPFACDMCTLRFKQSSDLQKHSLCHEDAQPYVCVVCDRRFRSRRSYRKHSLNHTSTEVYICNVGRCRIRFRCQTMLEKHIRRHVFKELKRKTYAFKCTVCCLGFPTEKRLAKHRSTAHRERVFACNLCSRKYFEQRFLDQHHINCHTNDKPYTCDRCFKSFGHFSSLKNHYHGHTKEKAHACDLCDSRFRLLAKLLDHYRLAHEREPDISSLERYRLTVASENSAFEQKYNVDERTDEKVHSNYAPLSTVEANIKQEPQYSQTDRFDPVVLNNIKSEPMEDSGSLAFSKEQSLSISGSKAVLPNNRVTQELAEPERSQIDHFDPVIISNIKREPVDDSSSLAFQENSLPTSGSNAVLTNNIKQELDEPDRYFFKDFN